jgi:hypothetical protein
VSQFLVVACHRCGSPWAVEARHAAARCPGCQARNEIAGRNPLWRGDDAQQARAVVASLRAGDHALDNAGPPKLPRHDSVADAAAARALGIVNRSSRAEAVAFHLVRLRGQAPHDELVEAMLKAGLDPDRAEAEITRMLALDVILEPRAGRYAMVAAV